MKLCSNVHTHSTWCDGENTPEEMVQAAIALGFTDLGFSSHGPTPFDPTCPGISDEDGYIAEILALKAKYAGQIGILCGVEQDSYAPVNKDRYEYVVGSHHFIELHEGCLLSVDSNPETLRRILDEKYAGNAAAMLKEYYTSAVEAAKRFKPTVVGHFDLIAKFNGDGSFFDEDSAEYKRIALDAMDALIDVVQGYGGLIEVNTGAMAKGWRKVPYPAPFLLKRMAERRARAIITSDCHRKDRLDAFFDVAQDLMRGAGFKQLAVLKDGAFQDVDLP